VLGLLLLENGRLAERAQLGSEKNTRKYANAAADRIAAAVEREQLLRDDVVNSELKQAKF